jgi:hypothetical protein
MSIFDLSLPILTERLTPPLKRQPKFLAWLRALTAPLQWVADNTLDYYAEGDYSADWDVATQYTVYDRIKYTDGSIYEAIAVPPISTIPTNTAYWYKVNESWVGVNERVKYNSQGLLFEFAINKHFGSTFRQPNHVSTPTRSDIYFANTSGNDPFIIGIDSTISDAVFVSESFASSAVYENYTININNFTLYVNNATFIGLGTTNEIREAKIRSFANKYIIAGMTYTVTSY